MTQLDRSGEILTAVRDYFVTAGLPEPLLMQICITDEDATVLYALIAYQRPRRILEIGSFIGVSTTFLALAASEEATVVSVDPDFLADVEGEKFDYAPGRGVDQFLKDVTKHFGVDSRVHHLRGFYSCTSQPPTLANPMRHGGDPEARSVIGDRAGEHGPFDLVFLDGDHCSASVASDLRLVATQLATGGVIALHDFIGGWASEVRAGTASFLTQTPGFEVRQVGPLGIVTRR